MKHLKLFDFFRIHIFKIQKPFALSWNDWEKWDKQFKNDRPIAYLITETIPNKLNRIKFNIVLPWNKLFSHIVCCYVNKIHQVNNNSLVKGKYYDTDVRILHSNFTLLVEFVENQLARSNYNYYETQKSVSWIFKKSSVFRKLIKFSNPDSGVDLIKKTMVDKNNNSENENYTPYARNLQELMRLYHWWKEVKPLQTDAYTTSGMKDFIDQMNEKYGSLNGQSWSKSEFKKYDELAGLLDSLESHWLNIENDMLLSLIKIRSTLWI